MAGKKQDKHGACPTCGHCRCCEAKPQSVPYYYPDGAYRPWLAPWYSIPSAETITTGDAACTTSALSPNFTLTSEAR